MVEVGDILRCNAPEASDGLLVKDTLYRVAEVIDGERVILDGVKTRFAPHFWYLQRFSREARAAEYAASARAAQGAQ